MAKRLVTLANINQWNQQFWLEQSELLNRRIQDPDLREIAMANLSAEAAMMVPVRNRQSLEQALAQAEKSRSIFQRSFSVRGGKAVKTDALQEWIIEMARAEPDLNTHELLRKMKKLVRMGNSIFTGVVRKCDSSEPESEHIRFDDNGESKTAPVSGLKDRLYRAKKKILSR